MTDAVRQASPVGGHASLGGERRHQDLRLSTVVMTHRLRMGMAERLRDSHPELDIRIVCDTAPADEHGSLRSAQAAWAAVGSGATHHLVLQDDVRLPGNFADAVRSVIESRPGSVSSLFVEWGAWTASVLRIAALTGSGWAEVIDDYVPSQAIVMPASVARGVGEYFEAALGGGEPDDVVLRRYMRSEGMVPHVCVPNLVEHLDAASLTGNQVHGLRCAACWSDPVQLSESGLRRSVTGVDAIPVMAWWGRPGAYFRIRDERTSEGWRKVPALDVLGGLGLSESELRGLSRPVLQDERRVAGPRRLLGEQLLFELWLASFSLGLRAADFGARLGADVLARVVGDEPVVRRAMTTLALGAFRNRVRRERLAVAAAVLGPFVRAAVLIGCETWLQAG